MYKYLYETNNMANDIINGKVVNEEMNDVAKEALRMQVVDITKEMASLQKQEKSLYDKMGKEDDEKSFSKLEKEAIAIYKKLEKLRKQRSKLNKDRMKG